MSNLGIRRLRLDARPRSEVAIATLCRDRPEMVRHFVETHRRLGVARIMVYFDDPADPVHDWTAAQQGVEAVRCDASFWSAWARKGDGKRPLHVEGRQRSAYAHAYRDIPPDGWIGFCDVDEVFVPKSDFASIFAKVASTVQEVTAPVAEAIWPPDASTDADFSATLLRTPQWQEQHRKLVGRASGALFQALTRLGLVGHVWGKAFVRGGIDGLLPGIHSSQTASAGGEPAKLERVRGNVTLVHYDAVSFPAWRDKHRARIRRDSLMGGNRISRDAQTDLLALAGGDEAVERRLFEVLHGSTEAYIAALTRAGALMRIDNPAAPAGADEHLDRLLERLGAG